MATFTIAAIDPRKPAAILDSGEVLPFAKLIAPDKSETDNIYEAESGIVQLPDGKFRVVWFKEYTARCTQ